MKIMQIEPQQKRPAFDCSNTDRLYGSYLYLRFLAASAFFLRLTLGFS